MIIMNSYLKVKWQPEPGKFIDFVNTNVNYAYTVKIDLSIAHDEKTKEHITASWSIMKAIFILHRP